MRRLSLTLLAISTLACGGGSTAGSPVSPSSAEPTYDVLTISGIK
jgi:hypothetical protein